MRDATLMHSIFFAVDDGDNHDKGNDNGSPTDTKMTGQKDLTRIILTNGWNDYSYKKEWIERIHWRERKKSIVK